MLRSRQTANHSLSGLTLIAPFIATMAAMGCTGRTGFVAIDDFASGDAFGDASGGSSGDSNGNGDEVISPQPVPVKVVAGDEHTCVLLPGARVKCWGLNHMGQLGYGHTDAIGDDPGEMGANLPYVDLGPGAQVVDISAGQYQTCALLQSGQIKCWGEASSGNLGNEDTEPRGDNPGETAGTAGLLKQPSGVTVTRMEAAKRNVCVLYDDASLRCSGQGDYGQLGNETPWSIGNAQGEMGDALLPIDLGAGRTVTHFAMGDYHNCAITDLPGVKCWGRGSYGRLGIGSSAHWGGTAGSMGDVLPYVGLGAADVPVDLALSYYGGCALLATQEFKCWGANGSGELALGNTNHIGDATSELGANLVAVDPGPGRTISAMVGGAQIWCAILADRSVLCAGRNAGALGQGTSENYGDDPGEIWAALAPIDFGEGRLLATATADSLAIGLRHLCAALDDDSLRCWGDSNYGQLGLGHTNVTGDEPGEMGAALQAVNLAGDPPNLIGTPANTPATGSLVELALGYYHACVRFDDGRVKCWGDNSFGQLGTEDVQYYGNDPGEMGAALPFVDLGIGRTAVDLAAGSHHTCVLLDDGSVKCWGAGLFGALGSGDELSVGWDPGQMGDNLPAVSLPTGVSVTRLEAGYFHTCALMSNEQLYCWGYGNDGQNGALTVAGHRGDEPGEMGSAVVPIDFGSGRTVIDFGVGERYLCVITDEQRVKCAGRGTVGRLGSGTTATTGTSAASFGDALAYVDLGPGELSTRIFVGQLSPCAEMQSGGFKCWGYNIGGQLGLGDTDDRGDETGEMGALLPAQLTGETVRAMAIGNRHICWLGAVGVRCMGANPAGQLGHGNVATFGNGPAEGWGNVPLTNLGSTGSVVDIEAGLQHTCAWTADGRVLCWGVGASGRLGTGASTNVGGSAVDMGDALQRVQF